MERLKVFYREYRPQKFSDVIGSDHIISALTSALSKGAPAHAYFFAGSRGIGKTTTARLMAKALNCANPKMNVSKTVQFEPCNECASCLAVSEGRHLDLVEIDAASNRGIDNIRDLTDKVNLSPTMGKRKIYIIDEVHMLTTEASNALLKTLEEPPVHAFFILCTTNPEKVLDTIKSRCQQFVFKKPAKDDLRIKLKRILDDKAISAVSDDDLDRVIVSAKGAFRDAENLLEQLVTVIENSGESVNFASNDAGTLLELIYDSKRKEAIEYVSKVAENEINIESWSEKFIQYVRAALLLKIGAPVGEFSFDEVELELIKRTNLVFLKTVLYKFVKSLEDFKYTGIPILPLEMAVIELTGQENESESARGFNGVNPPTPEVKKADPKPSATPKEHVRSYPLEKKSSQVLTNTSNVQVLNPVVQKKDFSFKSLMKSLEDSNRSIYLLLGSCRLMGFDGMNLKIGVPYSLHKERLMSNKTRTIIEESATTIVGSKVILQCDLLGKTLDALDLTDKNVKPVKDMPLEKVFEEVFGDDIEAPDPA